MTNDPIVPPPTFSNSLMSDFLFNGDSSESSGVMPVSKQKVPIRLAAVSMESTPPGMITMGAYLNSNVLGFTAVSPESFRRLSELQWSKRPVRLALPCEERADGEVSSLLCALVPVKDLGWPEEMLAQPEEEVEPWRGDTSALSWEARRAVPLHSGLDGGDVFSIDGELVALVPLGHTVRLPANRIHPDDIRQEAHDMLRCLLEGKAVSVIDKIIENEGL